MTTEQKTVNFLKNQFRILKGWKIIYHKATKRDEERVFISSVKPLAIIYGSRNGKLPINFLIHEVLHVAIRRLARSDQRRKGWHEMEELLVQDLCQILNGIEKIVP